jgi:hypothetical protein
MNKQLNIPPRHLSVRVPWHDSGWNGSVCKKPRENGSCMFLGRIQDGKDFEQEESNAGIPLHELDQQALPPCVSEKVTFMSGQDVTVQLNHPYAKNSNNAEFYGHYKPTALRYPAYSFSAVPYSWMLKNAKTNQSEWADKLDLDFDVGREPELGFDNIWVQQLENQRALLDAFISPIVPEKSLVFIYAKNVPYAEGNDRVLIGVGNIAKVGQLTEYDYDNALPESFRSTLWERPVYHTIRDDFQDGFLLPYHAVFEQFEQGALDSVEEYIAYAPSFEEFSYGSEWVSNDSAIESLLILRDTLKRCDECLEGVTYDHQYRWLDDQLSRLWRMRGPFPGLGSVLTGLKITEGNTLAWHLETLCRDAGTEEITQNPWQFVEKLFAGDSSFLPDNFKLKLSGTHKATWNNLSETEKDFLFLLSRINVNNDQVELVIDAAESKQAAWLENPYLLYEQYRLNKVVFPFALIDKALFTDQKILDAFPLPENCKIDAPLDQCRVRALSVALLERAADDGHTLQTESQLITALEAEPIEPLCNPSSRNLKAIAEYFDDEVCRMSSEDDEPVYFKLKRFIKIRDVIKMFVEKRINKPFKPPVDIDWQALVDGHFGPIKGELGSALADRDTQARHEKAVALESVANNRISVLIGPAGTGKTEVLKLLRDQPFTQSGTVLQLAPTGKARVNMGKDAQTLAQFLLHAKRYDVNTGRYFANAEAKQQRFDTVILDEASMVTEEQLSALIDSLSGVKRFILVGDYRQLPPIGAGKPFVDIIHQLRTENKGIAELKTLFRQFSGVNANHTEQERLDVWLGKWFSDDPIKKEQEDVFSYINASNENNFSNIRFVQWESPKHLEEMMDGLLQEEIEQLLKSSGRPTKNPQYNFDASLGATFPMEKDKNNDWACYDIASASSVEDWQILSPVNAQGYGTKAINQAIQRQYRGKTKEKAHFPGSWSKKDGTEIFNKRKMPRPVGQDNIVYGDKVINTSNTRWQPWWLDQFNPKNVPEEEILNYIANGEIGIHNGVYGGKWKGSRINVSFSSQPDYAYSFWPGQFKEDGKVNMELAYAISVHKSQGSGFGLVFFILPAHCSVLSRELFYTALTRQEDRVIILHQGDFNDYRRYTSGEFSETGRRLTDLFSSPELTEHDAKYYDSKHVQISVKGEFMISKSEVIIANLLAAKNIPYAYESPLSDEKGVTIKPDFTLEDDLGTTYYWEHLGMLSDDSYRSKWTLKKEWYERNGIVEPDKNPDADKQLLLTRDMPGGGIDTKAIDELIHEIFD